MKPDEIRQRMRAKWPVELATGEPVYYDGWTQDLFVRIAGIHNLMKSVRYMTDMEQFGVSDKAVVSYKGDCEDKCLKAHEDARLKLEIPRESLRILYRGWYMLAVDPRPHVALCIFATINGRQQQVVLDNTQRFLVYREQLRGNWIEI
jgi:predicted transglutaminase-like cysteine proteinase